MFSRQETAVSHGRCSSFAKSITVFCLITLYSLLGGSKASAFTKYAGEAFSIGVGARALGMGSAFVSMEGGTASIYWNPAGMSWGGRRELLAMHSERFGGAVKYDFIGYSHPLESGYRRSVLGFGLIRLGVSDIVETGVDDPEKEPGPDNQPFAIGSFGTSQYQLSLGYAREARGGVRIGGSVKIIHKALDDARGTGFGFDLGTIVPLGSGSPLSLGVVVQDVPTTFVAFNTGTKETTAPTLRTGLSLNNGIDVPGGEILVAAATSVRFTNRGTQVDQFSAGPLSFNLHLGAEYQVGKQVALRGGWDEGTPTAGAGIMLGRFAADYAWFGSPDEGLDNTHRMSIGFYF